MPRGVWPARTYGEGGSGAGKGGGAMVRRLLGVGLLALLASPAARANGNGNGTVQGNDGAAEESPKPRPRSSRDRAAEMLDESRVLPSRIEFDNQLARQFKLKEIRVTLDGREILRRQAGEDGELPQRFVVWNGPVQAGSHRLEANLVFQGRNRGPFTYLESYTVNVDTAQSFFARPDRAVNFTLVAGRNPDRSVPPLAKPVIYVRDEVEPATAIIRFGPAEANAR